MVTAFLNENGITSYLQIKIKIYNTDSVGLTVCLFTLQDKQ